jgi:alanine racemase
VCLKKTAFIAAGLLVLLGVFVVYSSLHGNFISDYFMKRDVETVLKNNGYKGQDIQSIEVFYEMKRNTNQIKGTVAHVTFKDEPNEKYIYIQWRNSKKIQQHCEYYDKSLGAYVDTYTAKRKHMDEGCTGSY